MEKKENVILQKKDNVYYLALNRAKANNFNVEFIRDINAKLDVVEKDVDICALVTSSNIQRFFSTGLDAKFISSTTHPEDLKNFLLEFNQLIGRVLIFPIPTIAILNGLTIAGGLMFAMAHDYRFMPNNNDWICLNEVDMGFALLPGMNAVVQCKTAPHAYRELFLAGRRIIAKDAFELGIIDFLIEDQAKMRDQVHEFANKIAEKSRFKENFQALKMEAYGHAYKKANNTKFGDNKAGLERIMSLASL